MIIQKLKICPFCGGEAIFKSDDYCAWVMCKKCGSHSSCRDSNEEAIKVWNQRIEEGNKTDKINL